MTRKVLIEQIRRLYYGGIPSDDSNLTENEVNIYINQAIAYFAKQNYTESINLDGIENVNDAFYATFKGLTITKDNDTGYYSATLPHPPVGLSRGYGISTVTFPVSTGLSKAPIPISPRELDYVDKITTPPSKIFYWAEGNKMRFKSYTNLNGKTASVRMIANAQTTLTDEMNLPDDLYPFVMDYILKVLNSRKATQPDIMNDNIDRQ